MSADTRPSTTQDTRPSDAAPETAADGPAAGAPWELLRLVRPVRGRLVLAAAAQTVAVLASLVPLVAVAEIGRALLAGHSSAAWRAAWIGAGAVPVRALFLAAATTLTHLADNDLQLLLRRRLVDHAGRLPLGALDGGSAGALRKAVADDVSALHHVVGHTLLDLVASVVAPVAALAYLFAVDPLMALVTLVPVAAGLLLHRRALGDAAARMPEYHAATTRLNSAAVEFVHGITVVKTFGQAGRAHHRFGEAAARYADFVSAWARSVTRYTAWSRIAFSPATVVLTVLAGGTALLQAGRLEPPDLLPFVLLGLGLTAPVLALGYATQDLRTAQTAAGRIRRLLARPPLPGPRAQRRPDGARVEFDGVRFAYDGRGEVLRGVDLVLEPGTLTALVGPSGAGKSTLAALLARFRDVTAGAVRIGGADVRDVPADELYRHVGFVLQETRPLRGSLRENIRLGRPEAGDDEVEAAARAARIHDRITELPRGYDTVAGDDVRLSGGEAQRIAIARALLADRPVLVLDEATASTDPESEAAIQDALATLVAGRTVLVIAHRLATVVEADRIAVLDGGRLVEQGRHDELLAAGGRYAALWRAQYGTGGRPAAHRRPRRGEGRTGTPGHEEGNTR
ncbi:ABC transporter ATP-binding protein [Streptomyces sp. DH37]|uniref:ABC transporter ATP-binding protein n=1 Tax=Streptomyces sp. DH37 TaxID=3040122 RepID=UPI0024432E12|nr:ABC transporter ATP-binding protein [Streptomyces sp. DH37]MDG9706413.1 ABC transporter ATP-binding protein [Streptomyces sp. DH37]